MQGSYLPKGQIIAALDCGSSKITCLIARITDDEGEFEVLGAGHHKSEGLKNGVIQDVDAVEHVIRKAVHTAENMASAAINFPLREVIVNLPATQTASYGRSIDVKIAGHDITLRDITDTLLAAQEDIVADLQDCTPIHTIAASYSVDGQEGIAKPVGLHGQSLHTDIHAIVGQKAFIQNINTATRRSHLDIASFCSTPYAAALAALVEDEMNLGALLIDIGGGTTSFSVFRSGALIYTGGFSVGGAHVTSDIAAGLTTSLEDAERIKNLYGCAMAADMDESELIDVPRLGEEQNRAAPNHVPRSVLVGIIQPRLEEIFELVRAHLTDVGLWDSIGRRAVLTGGAAGLAGIQDLAAHVLDKKPRVGRPIRCPGLPDAITGPAFCVAAGLLTYAATRGHESSALLTPPSGPQGWLRSAKHWLKENW